MSTKAELACVYSALLLVDDDVAVTVSMIYGNIFIVLRFNRVRVPLGQTRGTNLFNLKCTIALRFYYQVTMQSSSNATLWTI